MSYDIQKTTTLLKDKFENPVWKNKYLTTFDSLKVKTVALSKAKLYIG
jgi:hypothetical protein